MTATTLGSVSWSRRTALKVLYLYTLVGAGAFGIWLVLAPVNFATALGLPAPDIFMLGIVGAVYASFALIAAIGLRNPDAVAPAFFVQLIYKTLWLAFVFLPAVLRGHAPSYAWLLALVFITYIALDLVALPFSTLTSRDPQRPAALQSS